MDIVVAIDSFKGSASSLELAKEIKKGIKKVDPKSSITIFPIADGGEGTLEAFGYLEEHKNISINCHDPLYQKINSRYIILQNNTAVIEIAKVCGLSLVTPSKRDPSITTTYAVGELIKDAIDKGVREFIVGLGGSATNDAGLGMLRALGYTFLDKDNKEVILTKDMDKIKKIEDSKVRKELDKCHFLVACDVNNPLCGKNGASYIYAKQKGADEKMIKDLDTKLKHFSKIVVKYTKTDRSNTPGSGAAGGLGFAFLSFFNSTLKPGADIISQKLNIEQYIKNADLVITGEGKIDIQSTMGKVLSSIAKICKKHNTTCIAIAADVSEAGDFIHDIGIDAYFSIFEKPIELHLAMNKQTTLKLVNKKATQLYRLILSAKK